MNATLVVSPTTIHAAQAAIACEPLRESARCALIESYLAEGTFAEAHRELDRFSVLLWSELKVRPSESLQATRR